MGAGSADRLSGMEFGTTPSGQPRPLYRLEGRSTPAQYPLHCLQHAFSDPALGPRSASGVAPSRAYDAHTLSRLGTDVSSPGLFRGDLHRSRSLSRNVLPRGQLGVDGAYYGSWQKRPDQQAKPPHQEIPRSAADASFPRAVIAAVRGWMKPPVERIEVPIEELQDLLKTVREKLGAEGYRKLKAAIDTLAYLTRLIEDQETTIQKLRELLSKPASTEKTEKVLENAGLKTEAKKTANGETPKPKKAKKGHGRNGASAYTAAHRVPVPHALLSSGNVCPKCLKGKLYVQRDPGVL